MDALQARHRQEQRDLVARTTQKKKQASKKTRKGVNDECAALERELKERQAREIAELNGEDGAEAPANGEADVVHPDDHDDDEEVESGIADLSLNSPPTAATTSNTTTADDRPDQPQSSRPGTKKPNRAKARLARRAAEHSALAAEAAAEAAQMPDLEALEREKMHGEFARRGLREKTVRADGHCLYSAVADQLEQLGAASTNAGGGGAAAEAKGPEPYRRVRAAAATYMSAHPSDFEPFLEEPLDAYVAKVRDTGEWGGHLELLALARAYELRINVVQGDGRLERVDGVEGEQKEGKREIWLAYYRHGFGLGEHYNSLRRVG